MQLLNKVHWFVHNKYAEVNSLYLAFHPRGEKKFLNIVLMFVIGRISKMEAH